MTNMNNNDDIQQIGDWIRQAAPDGQLTSDSRRIAPGDVFFAYPNNSAGDAGDGRTYIGRAIEQGAAAVLYDPAGFAWNPEWRVASLPVADLKLRAGPIAHAVYGMPDAGMFTVGITGTNGKTSSAVWLGHALSRAGETAAVIGTLGVGLFHGQGNGRGEAEFAATGYTTPDQVLLARTLDECRAAGARALAIEVSSIGLEQGRVAGMHFDVALFTNLTRDHLDFHGSMEAYEAAKQKLFAWPGLKTAVINLDDPAGVRMASQVKDAQVIGYTLKGEAEMAALPAQLAGIAVLRASQVRSRSAGTEFHLESPYGAAQVKTRLVGAFNVSNALGVLGALLAKGLPLRAAVEAIEALTPAPGRMQLVGGNDAPMVVIDYAHTPDALEKTLEALRPVAADRGGQLWCVFGCGGDRDPGKRPQMGRIAQAADHVLVTSDNPRSEDPHAIIAQIVAGMDATRPAQAIEDRAAAILSAVKHAARNDVILVAGKGHEPYQEIKGKKLPFSDAEHAQLALTARLTMMRTN
ncbi:UDP-N-acetylmuramoyl-L-alanyl-D-glutamate--2,6-diaminopimelate ligase [Pseudoduganella albidiflava]|uniref:UDP-N-acetylmuramoyl-L-alanyl-D-glutamate--2,6-diaminopimelate ligase n=1 Tax=Pseudoduganella albidiflava TaxID=321983 RepID=A0A411X3N7_9BURK|nr:UDP-N-acetylmuramoyl-L-alanyl-D-glutamate--2,6-diaminopimelate ligase [Pseudoduganella albidiflava]QBI03498.1 UDP-N-acetylmuramoyl-L-alanyl-D-glutamate--2,6-diaminopimelate ligase [Pseudoduganella albidiflava]GGY50488.1 UDP-N-acetylmuramoyl-L-alanyl-D-glutamate--2,6-diaminopimelate ligase [Pseudoduganella albidiflava]